MRTYTFQSSKSFRTYLIIILILFQQQNSKAQWIELNGIGLSQPASQIPTSLADAECLLSFSEGNIIYVIQMLLHGGNCPYCRENHRNGFYKYYPQTNQWSLITNNLPTLSNINLLNSSSIGFTINGEYYCGLGYGNDEIWKYDSLFDNWSIQTNFPGGTLGGSTCLVLNNKAYLIGGVDSNYISHSDCWEYDPITNLWNQKNNFPGTERTNYAKWSIDTLAYVGLGNDSNGTPLNDLWEYNSISDIWSPKNNYPGSLQGKYIYFNQDSNLCLHADTAFWMYNYYSDTWLQENILDTLSLNVYGEDFTFGLSNLTTGFVFKQTGLYDFNPSTHTWSSKLSLNPFFGKGFELNSKVYVKNMIYDPQLDTFLNDTSGATWLFKCNNFGFAERNGNLEQYDPINNVWTQKARTPSNLGSGAIGFALGGYGYLGLGYDSTFDITNSFYQYNPISDSWTRKRDFPTGAKTHCIAVNSNTKAYVGMGLDVPVGAASGGDKSIYIYNPNADSWQMTSPLYARDAALSFVYNDEFYVGGGGARTPCMSCLGDINFYDLHKLDTNYNFNSIYSISGHTFYDVNNNGIFDSSDDPTFGPSVGIFPAASNFTYLSNGYGFTVLDSSYTVTCNVPSGYHLTTGPSVHSITINGSSVNNLDFGIYPDSLVSGIEIDASSENIIKVIVSPNPFNSTAQVKILKENPSDVYRVVLLNMEGKHVRDYGRVTSSELQIEKGILVNGNYLLQLVNEKSGKKYNTIIVLTSVK